MKKNYKRIILFLFIFLFYSFSVFAEETEILSNKIELKKEEKPKIGKEGIKKDINDYSLYISPTLLGLMSNSYFEFGISKKFNDYFELRESIFKTTYSSTLFYTDLKFFPFKQENAFFIGSGLGLEKITKYYQNTVTKKNDPYDSASLYYYIGLGYDVPIVKNIKFETLFSYSNVFNIKDNYYHYPFELRLCLVIGV
ncbi:MAG: hypothetical protein AABZ74_10700 [Cyanobacteriota bacterium]